MLEHPDRRTIRVHDTMIDNAGPVPQAAILEMRRHLGMLFQSFNLFSADDGAGECQRRARVLKRDAAEADDASRALLEQAGLSDKAEQHPAHL